MTALTWWLLALAVAGISFGLWQREARRRTLQHLSEMLYQAVAGGFAEERFDETALSALEGKFARFLRGSAAAKRAVEQERAAVQSLIADISHQTRTPIANLLLYTSLLAESDLKIRDVALQVGMSDQLYFNKIFRRHYGCSPSEYRRRLFKESQSPTLPDDPNTH